MFVVTALLRSTPLAWCCSSAVHIQESLQLVSASCTPCQMSCLCTVQVAASGRWRLSSSEVSDVLWALANARHWSRLLPQLEAALMAAGGVSACTAPELITVLWSYATLAHRPARLLKQLDSCGWAVKQAIKTPGAQHRGKTAEAEASRSWGQLPTEHHDEQGSVCRLDELSGAQLTSLIWSLACLQEVKNGLFRHVWVEVCKRGMALSGDVRQLVRVQQAALALQLEGDYKPQELYWDQGEAAHKADFAAWGHSNKPVCQHTVCAVMTPTCLAMQRFV